MSSDAPARLTRSRRRRRNSVGRALADDVGRRRGYTLMEVLLVLAIVVIAAAAVAPAFRGALRSAAIRAAANDVRTALTSAHVRAMKTGRTQVFQYELGGTKYKIEAYVGADDALEGPGEQDTTSAAPAPQTPGQLPPGEKALPEGTKFAAGDAAVESRGEKIEQEVSGSSTGGTNWSRPILFFADGSSVDAFVVVGNDHNAGIRLDLRGMTAAVRVSDISDLKTLENSQSLSR